MTHLQQTGESLRYGFGDTGLGVVLAAFGDIGVAAILLGDDRQRLVRELASVFPAVELREDQSGLEEEIEQVVSLIDAPVRPFALPLDIRGTDQERAVWNALRAIPAGETRTYGQIAKALPLPATAQEVGAACAANVLAVAIPCHRVVKADGSISGYRWGVQRKRRLINLEAAA